MKKGIRNPEKMILSGLLFIILSFGVSFAQKSVEDVYAVKAGTIHTVSMGIIENGTILIRNGIVQEVGQNVTIPPEAEIITVDTMHVYPGFIDAHTSIALQKPKSDDQGSAANAQQRKPSPTLMSPEKFYAEMLNPKGSKIKNFRETGVTTVLTAPEKGIFIGQSCLINLGGEKSEQMILKSPVALHIGYERQRGVYPSTLMAVIAFQRQTMFDAQHHHLLVDRYARQKRGWRRPEPNRSLEALFPALERRLPVIITAGKENEMKRAFKLIDEFKLDAIISGAVEGWRVIDQLKNRSAPLLVSVNFPKPKDVTGYAFQLKVEGPAEDKAAKSGTKEKDIKKKADPEKGEQNSELKGKSKNQKKEDPDKAALYANAGQLHKAGIQFAFTSGGLKKPADLLSNVKKTVEHGLPKEAAIQALTLNPARILGVEEQVGSIEAGKIANLVIATDDLFEEEVKVKYVFVDGKKYEIKEKKKAEGEPKVDVTGTWEGAVASPEGEESPVEITFSQDDAELSGSVDTEMGSANITEGSVAGNSIDFKVSLTIGGQSMTLIFTGTVEGDSMEGSVSVDVMGTGTWKVTKTSGPGW